MMPDVTKAVLPHNDRDCMIFMYRPSGSPDEYWLFSRNRIFLNISEWSNTNNIVSDSFGQISSGKLVKYYQIWLVL